MKKDGQLDFCYECYKKFKSTSDKKYILKIIDENGEIINIPDFDYEFCMDEVIAFIEFLKLQCRLSADFGVKKEYSLEFTYDNDIAIDIPNSNDKFPIPEIMISLRYIKGAYQVRKNIEKCIVKGFKEANGQNAPESPGNGPKIDSM